MGGTNNLGTVYKMTPAGTLTTLHSFTSEANVNYPLGPLFQGSDGNLYGTTYAASSGFPPPPNNGAVYKITTAGKITVLHTFAASPSDGQNPLYGVIQATDGNFYGVTQQGGANNVGTVYKMTAAGKVTLLHSFATADFGYLPEQGLVQTADGNFYGAASSCYGPGCYDAGSIFKITPTGTFSVPHDFDGTNGFNPSSPLLAHTNGILYGVTQQGGTGNDSVFYSLNIGAKPFLRLALTSGKAGTLVGMFGRGFDNTSVVKFGGVAATSITLTGSTYIVATVPAGALTGKVTVTTGSTTLTSSQIFTVHDSWTSGAVMPTAVFGPATGAIGTKVYVVGGGTSSAVVNINQIYNTLTNKWTTGAAMPTARFVPASAVVNGILYVIGGCDSGCTTGVGAMSVVEAYNPATNTWTTKAPLPTATDSVTAVVEKGIIYVIGGYVPGAGRVTTVFSYNPATDTWATEAPLAVGKSEAALGLLGTTIVAAGGYSNSGSTGDNEGYSASTNTWKTLAADPTARQAGCSAAISGLLYFAGGSGGSNGTSPLSVNESFSATTKKWTTLRSMPLAVIGPGSAAVNSLLYCIGGSNNGGLFLGTVYNNVQIYRP